MNSKEFENIFDGIAISNSFEKAFGGWFKESDECVVVLDLQKSSFADYYELNIKIFVQGIFGNTYVKDQDLMRKHIGDIFTRQPKEYKDVFDFEISIDGDKRKRELEELFSEFIRPFTDKALSRHGLKELAAQEKIFLLPAIKMELLKSQGLEKSKHPTVKWSWL